MKQTLLAVMLLVGLGSATFVHAASPYDWILTLGDEFGTPYEYDLTTDYGESGRMLVMNAENKIPYLTYPGPGLALNPENGYRLEIGGLQISQVENLADSLGTLTAVLAGKANNVHDHVVANISDFNSGVDARISMKGQSDWTQASTTLPDYIKNKPTVPVVTAMGFGSTTRSLDTAFRISTNRAAFVSYTVDIASTLSLTAGQTGTVILEYADDSGISTNVKTVQSAANGNTGTLAIGLGLTQTATASLSGMIPAGKYVRIRTVNTAGTPTFTYRAEQEVTLPSN